jgi:hypothetical protein
MVAAFVVALGAGIASSFVVNQAFPTISTVKELRAVAQTSVLGSISYRPTPAVLRRRKQTNYAFAGGVAGLCVLFGVALSVWLVAARMG